MKKYLVSQYVCQPLKKIKTMSTIPDFTCIGFYIPNTQLLQYAIQPVAFTKVNYSIYKGNNDELPLPGKATIAFVS